MTATTFDWKIDSDTHEVLPNFPLSQLIQKNLELLGPPQFTEEEKAFAKKTQTPLGKDFEYPLSARIESLPAAPEKRKGSTDVGEVSWRVPTGGLRVASYTFGAPSHSWYVVACTGTSIGDKGLFVAARALAFTALDLFANPANLDNARADFQKRKGHTPFKSLLPNDQKAPRTIR